MSEKKHFSVSAVISFFHSHSRAIGIAAMTVIMCGVITFIYSSFRIVSVIKEGNSLIRLMTLKTTASEIVEYAGLPSNYEVLSTVTEGKKLTINVYETYNVEVTYDNETVDIKTASCTVDEAIAIAGFNLGELDVVNLDRNEVITADTNIDVVHVEPKVPDKPKNTVPAMYKSDTEIHMGSDNTISTLTPDIDIELDENGLPINYTSAVTVQATAYTYTGFRCSTGVYPQPGYIAVNPKVIPYGTKMYIVSEDGKYRYGYAVAADTGGFIKTRPTNVDLFLTSEAACCAFGRRNVRIYFLE